ncbi:MAG: enoyl-CoA hydratase-related protein [Pseudonocardia sp.]|nr:enoyl-CoA hydratase-related protein [Pseudonocardia sp.]
MTEEDGVATVLVDSPPVNAMGRVVLDGLGDAAEHLSTAREVRAVVLSGVGTTAFMAGADIGEFEQLRAEPGAMEAHSLRARAVFDAWQALPQPVVAAVQASAVGGGLEIALLCDLIVADPGARFGLPEVKLGLIPGGGGTQRLPGRIGTAAAKEMLFLGSTIDADRAVALGLANRISAPGAALAEAQELAGRIAALPRIAVTCAKRAVGGAISGEALDREREIFLETFASRDFAEGFAAFQEKRAPRFVHQ